MHSEFDLIKRLFTRPAPQAELGVGDDAALIASTADCDIAVSTDMLVSGTHFLADTDAYNLGWKSLAVNLSDMAAMGATPRWATLAIALPEADEAWLSAFSEGFFSCARAFDTDLVGGDTTRGPLAISVTIMGEVPHGQALRRDSARAGDDIWVSGTLGGAALGLAALQGRATLDETMRDRCTLLLEKPQPRVALGVSLRALASAAIDISDGLIADLGHILERSNLGAEVHANLIPAHPALENIADRALARKCMMAGGDDYELCFIAAPAVRQRIETISTAALPLTRIGRLTAASGLRILDADNRCIELESAGYDHFA